MPGQDPGGFAITTGLGIVGALLGGWIGRVLGFYREGAAAGFIMAVVGAIVVLALYRLVAPTAPELDLEGGFVPLVSRDSV